MFSAATPISLRTITVSDLTAQLAHPFPVASDPISKEVRTENLLITMTADDGLIGYGEAAPFQGISGDTRALLAEDLRISVLRFCNRRIPNYEEFSYLLRHNLRFVSACAAVEMAFLDLQAKKVRKPLAEFLNPHASPTSPLTTDITIPMVSVQKARALAQIYMTQGFQRIKIKVGDTAEKAERRIKAVAKIFRNAKTSVEILIDANEGYTADAAIHLLRKIFQLGVVKFFEQPVARKNLCDLKRVKEAANAMGIKVLADESVYTLRDAEHLIAAHAADGINLKLMKHGGIMEAMQIATLAREQGLLLMIGGMVETRLAMGASAHLAAALGGVDWLDLDTPLLLQEPILIGGQMLEGGLQYAGSNGSAGPNITLPIAHGMGVYLRKVD